MLKLTFDHSPGSPLHVLCLGAHSDDIEIGCGGTILKLIESRPNLEIWWVVFSTHERREIEAQKSADDLLKDVTRKQVILKNFRDGYFPYIGAQVKDFFEHLKSSVHPDLIFTHYRNDLHQDHRLISELTWNTFRNHLIMEYEIPKYDGDLGSPNFFVPIQEELCTQKVEHILHYFATQDNRHWFTADTFWSMLRLRGIECGSPGKYAEAFYCRKIIVGDKCI